MKKHLLILALLLTTGQVFAKVSVSFSDYFEDPNDWNHQLFICKNGNTFYFKSTYTELDVKVYDRSHKLINDEAVPAETMIGVRKDNYDVLGVYEVNNQMMVFLRTKKRHAYTLYRILFDAGDGKLVKAETLYTLKPSDSYGNTIMQFESSDFYISQDATTEDYCILLFNGFSRDEDRAIEAVVYNNKHEIINRGKIEGPAAKGVLIHFGGLCLFNRKVFVGTNQFDGRGPKTVPYYLSVLNPDSKAFTSKQLEIKPYYFNNRCTFAYNPGTDKLEIVITSLQPGRKVGLYYVNSALFFVNPYDLTLSFGENLSCKKLDYFCHRQLGMTEGFVGIPEKMIIEPDFTTTLVYDGSSMTVQYGQAVAADAGIGILHLDTAGNEVDGYVAVRRQKTSTGAGGGNIALKYFGYNYFSAEGKEYLIYNDIPENVEKPLNEAPHPMSSIGDANAILHQLEHEKIESAYLFGIPERKRQTMFIVTNCSCYDPASGTYATIVVDKKEGKKGKIAWVSFKQ
jgi:hypothetical protein